MAVKVSSLSSGSINGIGGNDPASRADKSSNNNTGDTTGINHSDTVNLTGMASQLQQMESQIAKMPIVDAQLVEEVQRMLATGNFRVNPDSAATKLLTLETSLP
jgi:negative regulator of flagellin synthesis FlgM